MKIHIDDSELVRLELDLSRAPMRIKLNASSAVRRSAAAIDKQMTIDAAGHQGSWFGIPGTSYDTALPDHVSHEMLGPLSAEIGIEYKGAGMLAHIIVFGSVNNPGGQYDHMAGPRRALPTVDRLMADAAEESVFGQKGKNA